jgi:hypothetical protein
MVTYLFDLVNYRQRAEKSLPVGRGTVDSADMTSPRADISVMRHVICARCGQAFECNTGGDCWCAAEPYRLPLPEGRDCLCPDCLRSAAGARQSG